jgi:hypothetical protein
MKDKEKGVGQRVYGGGYKWVPRDLEIGISKYKEKAHVYSHDALERLGYSSVETIELKIFGMSQLQQHYSSRKDFVTSATRDHIR